MLGEHIPHVDFPGEVARIHDVINLRVEMPLFECEQGWEKDGLAEYLRADHVGGPFPIEIEHIAGWDLAPCDVMVGNRLGGVAVGINQQDDVFGTAAGVGSGSGD